MKDLHHLMIHLGQHLHSQDFLLAQPLQDLFHLQFCSSLADHHHQLHPSFSNQYLSEILEAPIWHLYLVAVALHQLRRIQQHQESHRIQIQTKHYK